MIALDIDDAPDNCGGAHLEAAARRVGAGVEAPRTMEAASLKPDRGSEARAVGAGYNDVGKAGVGRIGVHSVTSMPP